MAIAGLMVMALTTYVIRVSPFLIFRRKITNRRVQSFLFYVPYVVLSAMTFPAVFYATGNMVASIAGTIVATGLAYRRHSLLVVAIGAAAAVLVVELV
nr:AzlD domain-containing protein [uncultured Dubosiella sp.]